jgi:hypothetical protein
LLPVAAIQCIPRGEKAVIELFGWERFAAAFDKEGQETRHAGMPELFGSVHETNTSFLFSFSGLTVTPVPVLGSEIGAAKSKAAEDHDHHQVILIHYDPPFFGES